MYKKKSIDVAKYFIHGALVSLVFTALASIFTGLLTLLMILIGGFLNALITSRLWSIGIKADAWDLLLHGVVLYIPLVIVNVIFVFLPLSASPTLETLAVVLIIQAFLDGLIAKKVAEHWEEDDELESIEREWKDREG